MNLTAMSERIADQVVCALLNQGLLKNAISDEAMDVAEDVIEDQLNALLSDEVVAMLTDRITKAMRVLAGPNPMEQAVAQNRRGLGLPPQCLFCDCAPDQHRDYVPPVDAAALAKSARNEFWSAPERHV